MQEEYETIATTGEGFYKEKGSKFYGFAVSCLSKEEAKDKLENWRKRNPGCCHVCFAWRFGIERYEDRFSDDGEPNNSAGKPIFAQIESSGLTNILVAVVRFYGGTNLGVGGLIGAYRTAAKDAIQNAKTTTLPILHTYTVSYEYDQTGTVMSALDRVEGNILQQEYQGTRPSIMFSMKKSKRETLESLFQAEQTIELKALKNE